MWVSILIWLAVFSLGVLLLRAAYDLVRWFMDNMSDD
jgi:hypothetical protein